ncbi:hypothetical protein A2U01_0062656, partial [Trifolium medium]|nr:hypothetical protein [Trifolium medium]
MKNGRVVVVIVLVGFERFLRFREEEGMVVILGLRCRDCCDGGDSVGGVLEILETVKEEEGMKGKRVKKEKVFVPLRRNEEKESEAEMVVNWVQKQERVFSLCF